MQITVDNIMENDKREIKEKNLAFLEYLILDLNLLKNICLKDVESKILEKFGVLAKNNKKYMSTKFINEEINFYKENGYMFSEGEYLFLTEKFYDYVIENYEVEEEMLPDNYDNISDEIQKCLNKIKSDNEDDNIDPMMKMFNKSLKIRKVEDKQKKKELNNYTVNLINQIFKK